MPSLNKVFLMGNLTRDPELRYTPGGSAVAEFGLAVNRRYTTGNGEQKDETTFVDIVVWGKQAETCQRYLQRGAGVFIEGRLLFDQWTEKESQKKRSRLRVVAERFQFIGRRDEGQPHGQPDEGAPEASDAARPPKRTPSQGAYQRPPQQRAPQAAPPAQEPPFEVVEGVDDDIPF